MGLVEVAVVFDRLAGCDTKIPVDIVYSVARLKIIALHWFARLIIHFTTLRFETVEWMNI